ncbi:MAG: hypothetical protein QM820_39210 [Minicystis sp.]
MTLQRLTSLALIAVFAVACRPDTESLGTDEEPLESAEHAESIHALASWPGPGPLIPQSSPLVKEVYRFESKSWVRWAMGLPFSTGPITDTTGAACAQGQAGPVWYLAGTNGGSVTRSCTIPQSKFIFIPLINSWVVPTAEAVEAPEDLAEYLDFVNAYIPDVRAHTCNLKLRLDGAPLLATQEQLDSKLWVQVLEPFPVQVNDDNFGSEYGRPGGLSPVVVEGGHYALLRPLSRGSHVLEIGGALCEDDGTIVFETSAVYNLTVGH